MARASRPGVWFNGCECTPLNQGALLQFHISGLFPQKRGFISALFVAGFTGCGIIFYILERVFQDLGGNRCAEELED